MIIANKFHPNHASDSIQNTPTNHNIRLVDAGVVADLSQRNDFRGEDQLLNCDQENGFFKGLLIMIPCSILLWIMAIWGVRSLIY